MAHQYPKETKESHTATKEGEEATGCGMFDFLKKENEKHHHQDHEPHKHTLAEKLHSHDGDSSSSSSDEEGGEKMKKGLKGKIKEKISSKKEGEDTYHTSIPIKKGGAEEKGFVEKIKEKLPGQQNDVAQGGAHAEEKGFIEKIKEKLPGQHNEIEKGGAHAHAEEKGFMEKIKEKLPGQHTEANNGASGQYYALDGHSHDGEPKEKKGIMEQIKEKLPGGHKNEVEKPKEY